MSCIYRGMVRHRRHHPAPHRFQYPLFMMYLDLEELPSVFDRFPLWSARRAAPAWFRRADYLGDPEVDLATAVRDEAERLTGSRPEGPIRMLTHLRYFGYMMNPVSFYYCFAPDAERVETILAQITNTPWGERHTYALTAGDMASPVDRAQQFAKRFHISPFMAMEQQYEWQFTQPGGRLNVHMESSEESEKVFDATLSMRRIEITGRSLAAALLRHPWMTARVATGIYWQALRLWLKRTPYHEHPHLQTP